MKSSRSHSHSTDSSVKEVKRVRVSSPLRRQSHSPHSSSDDEETYHVGFGKSTNEDDTSQWGHKTSAAASAHSQSADNVVSATMANTMMVGLESPPECKTPPEDRQALEWSQQVHHIVMPYKDRQSQQKPHWFLEASCEPRQMNTQNEAIGHGSFFKCWPYDYTNKEFSLPQGHEDHIRMVNSIPPTGTVVNKKTTTLSYQQIGWDALENSTPCLTIASVQGHGKVLPWVTTKPNMAIFTLE